MTQQPDTDDALEPTASSGTGLRYGRASGGWGRFTGPAVDPAPTAPVDQLAVDARLLIVDDHAENLRRLTRILTEAGYQSIHATTDPFEGIELYRTLPADLVLLDLHMPMLNGLAVLRELRVVTPPDAYVPIIMLTGDDSPEARRNALSMGAKDFITKPFHLSEVLLRIRNLLETRSLHRRLQDQNRELESRVAERTEELEAAQVEILERLAGAAEFRDDETGQHTHRVGRSSGRLAEAIGLGEHEVALVRRAAPLHDVGKIGIPDAVLLKPASLTQEEMAVMRTHTTIGAAMLSGGKSEMMRAAEQIALSHHERWDGSGYPHGLLGASIPLRARIVAIADVFDALTSVRPYRGAWAVEAVLEQLSRFRGSLYDPQLVDAFLGAECYRR
jgi:putative two-component system response regulator